MSAKIARYTPSVREEANVNARMRLYLAIALTTLALSACGGGNTVSGTITFDGDSTIPEGAVMTVQLRDVSYQDAAAPLINSQIIVNPGRFPVDFSVPYDPDAIDDRAIYGLQVRVTLDDRLIFINDTAFDVLTRGNPSRGVKMWVIAVRG